MRDMGTDQAETFTEWASAHGPTSLITGLGKEITDVFLMPTGRDKSLAELRVTTWRQDRPDVPSWLLQREVTRGPWQKVEESDDQLR